VHLSILFNNLNPLKCKQKHPKVLNLQGGHGRKTG
jgi:hypothetical protein